MNVLVRINILVVLFVSISVLLDPTHSFGQASSTDDSSPATEKDVANSPSADLALVTNTQRDYMVAYRYNVRTGEAWITNNKSTEWAKIAETIPISEGKYEIQVVGPYGDDRYMTFRIDRKTGHTWFEKNHKWNPYFEPNDKKRDLSNSSSADFSLVTNALRSSMIAYRYNVRTGETWKKNTAINWAKVAETAPIAKGKYEIQISGPFGPSDKDTFVTMRIDRETGHTWYEQNGKWKPHVEPSDQEKSK